MLKNIAKISNSLQAQMNLYAFDLYALNLIIDFLVYFTLTCDIISIHNNVVQRDISTSL